LRLMERAQYGESFRPSERVHQRQNGERRIGIKTRDRFVRKQDATLLGKRTRDCDTLLLTSGERIGTL